MPAPPLPLPAQAFNDVLATTTQAEVNEGGPPPVIPCDTPSPEHPEPTPQTDCTTHRPPAPAAIHSTTA